MLNKNNLILVNAKIKKYKNNVNIILATIVNITKNVNIFLNLSSKFYSNFIHKDIYGYIIKIKKVLNIVNNNKKNIIIFLLNIFFSILPQIEKLIYKIEKLTIDLERNKEKNYKYLRSKNIFIEKFLKDCFSEKEIEILEYEYQESLKYEEEYLNRIYSKPLINFKIIFQKYNKSIYRNIRIFLSDVKEFYVDLEPISRYGAYGASPHFLIYYVIKNISEYDYPVGAAAQKIVCFKDLRKPITISCN